jgi:hypothetical protein
LGNVRKIQDGYTHVIENYGEKQVEFASVLDNIVISGDTGETIERGVDWFFDNYVNDNLAINPFDHHF